MVTGNAVVCGLMANPVGHSLSPMMHNYYAQALDLDYIYVPCLVKDGDLGAAVQGAYALGFTGLNVTIPYKKQVIDHITEIDGAAKCVGAVNTLVRTATGYKGYNSDIGGLFRSMKEQGMEIAGQDCLLIGAGGAAMAAAYLFCREGAGSITILNRSLWKAQELAENLEKMIADMHNTGTLWGGGPPAGEAKIRLKAAALDEWKHLDGDSYLAVQTTSVGMHPHVEYAPIEDRAFYKKIKAAVEVIYTPAKTRFMEYVEEAGGRVVNGLDMLIYQGVESFELWNPGVKIPVEVTDQIRQKMEAYLNG